MSIETGTLICKMYQQKNRNRERERSLLVEAAQVNDLAKSQLGKNQ